MIYEKNKWMLEKVVRGAMKNDCKTDLLKNVAACAKKRRILQNHITTEFITEQITIELNLKNSEYINIMSIIQGGEDPLDKSQVICCKRVINYRDISLNMMYNDKASERSSPPCNVCRCANDVRYECSK